MKKTAYLLSLGVAANLLGCATSQGEYLLEAYDQQGNRLYANKILMVSGSRIQTAFNGICINNPGAKVLVRDLKSREESRDLSPYKCRG